jgi:hypothetical protein
MLHGKLGALIVRLCALLSLIKSTTTISYITYLLLIVIPEFASSAAIICSALFQEMNAAQAGDSQPEGSFPPIVQA